MKRNKSVVLILYLTVIVVVFEACCSEHAENNEKTIIKVANWDTNTNTPYIKNIVKNFEIENPDIKVEIIEILGADFTNKLSVMLNSGGDVDVFWIKDSDITKRLWKNGQLADLNEYIQEENLDLSVFNGLADYFVMDDGKIVALPASVGFYLLYYNKDIFDDAGIPYPSNDMTWSEFEDLAGVLTKGEGTDKVYGALIHTWQACVQNLAVQDGENTILATDYTFMKPYYEMILRMQNEGSIIEYVTLKIENIHYSYPFYHGRVAMLPMGSWFSSNLIEKQNFEEESINWGIATIPHAENIPAGYTVGSITPIAMNAASKKKDAAWRFIYYVCGEEAVRLYTEYGAISSRIGIEEIDMIADADGMPEGCLEALRVQHVVFERPIDERSEDVNQMMKEEHNLIMLGAVSIDDGLSQMAEKSKAIQGQ